MISVNKQPDTFAAARNNVPYKITTNNHLTASGSNAYFSLQFTSIGPNAAGTFSFEYAGQGILIEFVDTLSDAGYVYYNYNPDTLVDYLTLLAAQLPLAHPLIQRDWVVTFDGTDTILFENKHVAEQPPFNFVVSLANTSIASQSVGNNNEYRQMQNLVDVFIEDEYMAGAYSKVATLSSPPNTIGESEFNLKDIFLDALGYDAPILGESGVTACINGVKRAYITPAEYYDTVIHPAIVADPGMFNVFRIINAGLDYYRTSFASKMVDILENKVTWLTNMPRTFKTSLVGRHWLYFYCDIAGGTYEHWVKFFMKNGGISWHKVEDVTLQQYYIQRMPIHPSNLAGAVTLSDVRSIGVVLTTGGSSSTDWVTEMIIMDIDPIARQYNRQFIFSNSLGGFDTIWCYGRTNAEAMHSQEEIQTKEPTFEGDITIPIDGYKASTNKMYLEKYVTNSGWQPKAQIQNIARELPLAAKIYEVRDDGLLEVLCKNVKTEIVHDDEYKWAISFEWEYAFNEFNSKTVA